MREWKLGFLIEVCLRLCRFELIRPTVGDCEIFSHHSHNALESFLGNAVGNFHPEPAPQDILQSTSIGQFIEFVYFVSDLHDFERAWTILHRHQFRDLVTLVY